MVSKDGYYEESNEGFDAVMGRMMEVVGNPAHISYAIALDVNENTIKTWRRRGEVSTKFIKGFAEKHNVSLDYLMRGESEIAAAAKLTAEQTSAGYSVEVLSKEEQALLDNYRNCPQEAKQQIEASSALFAQLRKKKA